MRRFLYGSPVTGDRRTQSTESVVKKTNALGGFVGFFVMFFAFTALNLLLRNIMHGFGYATVAPHLVADEVYFVFNENALHLLTFAYQHMLGTLVAIVCCIACIALCACLPNFLCLDRSRNGRVGICCAHRQGKLSETVSYRHKVCFLA